MCAARGQTSAFLQQQGLTTNVSVCAVSTPANGYLTGYQTSDANTTCTVAMPDGPVTSQAYACLCQEPTQQSGLEVHTAGATCAAACNVSEYGLFGAAAETDFATKVLLWPICSQLK